MKTGTKRKADHVEDRYYTKEEYNALTASQKKELAAKRLKRGHKPGEKDSKVRFGKGQQGDKKDVIRNLKAVNRQVAQLAKQMGKAGVSGDDETTDSTHSAASTQEGDAKTRGNRNNPSLTRQKKVPTSDKK